jgi:hypothetical protein
MKDIWSTYCFHAPQAKVNAGWLGFGITEAGAMKGADIVYYQSSAPSVITDAYALDFVTPTKDDNQDWILLTASSDGGWLTVEATRDLDTQARGKNGFSCEEATLMIHTAHEISMVIPPILTVYCTGPTGRPSCR